MIELGKMHKLEVIKGSLNGVYLNSKIDKDMDDILVPKNQLPQGIKAGDEIEVFVYRDSEERVIATTDIHKLLSDSLEYNYSWQDV